MGGENDVVQNDSFLLPILENSRKEENKVGDWVL